MVNTGTDIFWQEYNWLQSGDAKCGKRMKNSSLWLMIVGTALCLGACKSAPETMQDTQESAASLQASSELEPIDGDSVEPEQKASKVVMWVYKNHDSWSKVITTATLDIRGEETDSSRCQGAADVQHVGQCVNWSLSVPCETEGEKWLYGEKAQPNGSICRAKSGEWAIKSPQSFQDRGDCQLKVLNTDGAAEQVDPTFRIDCSWLSEDRMKKGSSTFSFGPVHQ